MIGRGSRRASALRRAHCCWLLETNLQPLPPKPDVQSHELSFEAAARSSNNRPSLFVLMLISILRIDSFVSG